MYGWMDVCTYVRTYVCMYVCTHVRMYVCMYGCMYARSYVRTYVCMNVFVCVYEIITAYGHTANSPGNSTCVVSRTMAHCDTAVLPV